MKTLVNTTSHCASNVSGPFSLDYESLCSDTYVCSYVTHIYPLNKISFCSCFLSFSGMIYADDTYLDWNFYAFFVACLVMLISQL